MAVRRIVANVAADDIAPAAGFYRDILGLRIAMDLGWIVTFEAAGVAAPQVSIASQGGAGTPVPDLSVEVDDFDALLQRLAAAGIGLEYGPVRESWGVRRCHVRDPFGRLVNILTHV